MDCSADQKIFYSAAITLTSDTCDRCYRLWVKLSTLSTCHPNILLVQPVFTGLVEYDTSKSMIKLSSVQKQNIRTQTGWNLDLAILES